MFFTAFSVLEQISPSEYAEDVEKPMSKSPENWNCIIVLAFIPVVNIVALLVYWCLCATRSKTIARNMCENFNKKYEKERGVKLSFDSQQAHRIKVVVSKPGQPLPGVVLFTPCKEDMIALEAFSIPLPGQSPSAKDVTETTTTVTTTAITEGDAVLSADDTVSSVYGIDPAHAV